MDRPAISLREKKVVELGGDLVRAAPLPPRRKDAVEETAEERKEAMHLAMWPPVKLVDVAEESTRLQCKSEQIEATYPPSNRRVHYYDLTTCVRRQLGRLWSQGFASKCVKMHYLSKNISWCTLKVLCVECIPNMEVSSTWVRFVGSSPSYIPNSLLRFWLLSICHGKEKHIPQGTWAYHTFEQQRHSNCHCLVNVK